MSENVGSHLQIPSSYNHNAGRVENYRTRTIEPSSFHGWTEGNMYKSSYAHFHSGRSLEPKNTAIPGYGGYVPSIKAENIHARGFSAMAKQSFNQGNLGVNTYGLATTGFNLDPKVLIDQSKLASSSKYGKTEIQNAHPNWNASGWVSTTHDFYKNPKLLLNPTYRQTDKHLETNKPLTKGSGFATNHSFLDGHGWKPLPVLNGDNDRSEYRDRFNAEKAFHRDANITRARLLKKKEYNYKYN